MNQTLTNQAFDEFILTNQEKSDVLEHINATYDISDITYNDYLLLIEHAIDALDLYKKEGFYTIPLEK